MNWYMENDVCLSVEKTLKLICCDTHTISKMPYNFRVYVNIDQSLETVIYLFAVEQCRICFVVRFSMINNQE